MKNKCYVTTPIYYASATPQLGNSYSTVAADVFARYNRLMNRDTFFLTGMDEHGQKIENAAKLGNMEPQAYVNKIAEGTKKIWTGLNISNDYFVRTTDDNHVKTVQSIFEKMLKKGDIYLGSYEGHYCVSCESFFTKTQLGEGDTCPDCGKPVKLVKEESYFLNLKKYAPRLLEHIETHPDFITPVERRNEVISFIKGGLEDLCVSRTSFKWGVPVLSNPKHVVYVWIDALANYITALGYNQEDDSNYKKYWLENDNIYHVVGKDILRFHAIYWPIMLMSLDIPINFKLLAHGWILNRDGKMSKSRGNAVYSEDLYPRYGADAVRYYLAKELPVGNDGLFSYERFIERFNNELVNDLGNLVSRSIAMVIKYFDGIVPTEYKNTEFDANLEEVANNAIKNTIECFDKFALQDGINATWTLVNKANKYIDETCPWVLAKDESKKEELASVMYHLIESIRVIANLTAPYLTTTSKDILNGLGLNAELSLSNLTFGMKYENVKVSKIDHLFKRLDEQVELDYFKKLNEERASQVTKFKENVKFDDFTKLDIRVGTILECENHPNADKLLVSKVKVGSKVLQIVSGIANHYKKEEMVGKHVCVVCNLEPVKLRGVDSYGMLLCAENDKEFELITLNVNDGAIVK